MLNELGRKYHCDKVDQWHTFKGKTYFDVYEMYLSEFREKKGEFEAVHFHSQMVLLQK